MPTMSWAFVFVLVGLMCFLMSLLRALGGRWKTPPSLAKRKMLPPGPPGLPIIGNLLMLGNLPHHTLHSLANVYGPIMYIKLGFVPSIVVSSPQAAKQFLKTHDLIFASRPVAECSKYMSYGCKGIAFSPYGPYWRNVRKLCTSQMLTNAKIDSFSSMRREDVRLLVKSLKDKASARATVNVSSAVAGLITDIICSMTLGRKFMDEDLGEKGFKGLIREGLRLMGTFNVADYIPFVGVFDLQGLRRQMKEFSMFFDEFMEKIIDERVQNKDLGNQMDLIDIMLAHTDTEFQLDRTNIKAIILDVVIAGIDTSSITIEWALSELFKHPEVMKKAQEELKHVVGMDRMVEESDLDKLEYVNMVVKETFRLHPVSPLPAPHEATEDCMVNGLFIPKKSRIIINIWAIGRNPSVWSDAEKFLPERFAGSNIDVRGQDFELIPFGSGRRGCPGMQLGLIMVRLTLAQLIHCFDWELPNGLSPDELDMIEDGAFGLSVPRANPLMATPSYRLRSDI